jgi:ABC-type phosphate transport system substrate-binding protein
MRFFEVVKDEFRKNDGEIKLPTRASENSAGYDNITESGVKFAHGGNCEGKSAKENIKQLAAGIA